MLLDSLVVDTPDLIRLSPPYITIDSEMNLEDS